MSEEKTNVTHQGILGGIRTLADGTLKIDIVTMEISSDAVSRLFSLRGKNVKFYITNKGFISDEQKEVIDDVDLEIKGSKKQSRSQRLRSSLFVYWQQNKDELMGNYDYETFDDFYTQYMEDRISKIKSKLK